MNIFKTAPSRNIDQALQLIIADPTILGDGWRLLGKGTAATEGSTELLLTTPTGELVICLAADSVDMGLLTRGLTLLGQARQALPLLQAFHLSGTNGQASTHLLLLGGTLEPEALNLASAEISFRMIAELPGQPGPPLLLGEIPFATEPQKHQKTPCQPPGNTRPGRMGDRVAIDDEEIAQLISC